MELFIHERDDISYVALVGRLDAMGVNEVEERFAEATSSRERPAVVDISGVTFMSSLGIGFLFVHTKKLKKAGCKLVLLNPQGMVNAVLKTSKMEKVMPLVYELAEAIQMVGGDPTFVAKTSSANANSTAAPQESKSGPAKTADNILKLTIKNSMSELDGLYATVSQFLSKQKTTERSAYALNLAIEELVVNVIRYAYDDDDGEHSIDIGLGVFDEQIVLEIRDSGQPFDPRDAPRHDVDVEDLQVGGLGLTLVLDMVDSLTYRRENDKNNVRVCIHIRDEESNELSNALNDGASETGD